MAILSDYIDDPRFSRTFELPADAAKGRPKPFKVKYADYGYRNEANPEEETVFLFFGSMVASRLVHIAKDEIAKTHKIRILNADRPGFGGTDAIDAKRVLSLWLAMLAEPNGLRSIEAIPALLKHLGICDVSLGCHSGGTIFALDLILNHPEVLSTRNPYLAIGAPWILPGHTSSTMMAIMQSLPASIISKTDRLARLINNHVGPILGICFGLSQAVMTKLSPTSSCRRAVEVVRDNMERSDAKFEEDLWPKIIERIYAEGVHGISTDALLLMQKVDGMNGWGDWGDYDTLIPRLVEALRASGRRLIVEVFYAESDTMIGDGGSKGPLWFDQCWDVKHRGDVVEYRSTVIKGADHDGIWNLRWGAVQKVFDTIGQ